MRKIGREIEREIMNKSIKVKEKEGEIGRE